MGKYTCLVHNLRKTIIFKNLDNLYLKLGILLIIFN